MGHSAPGRYLRFRNWSLHSNIYDTRKYDYHQYTYTCANIHDCGQRFGIKVPLRSHYFPSYHTRLIRYAGMELACFVCIYVPV